MGKILNQRYSASDHFNERIDILLSQEYQLSRNQIKRLIVKGEIRVNGAIIKPSYLVKKDDIIEIISEEKRVELTKENIPLDIVYEDNDIIIINKAKGMLVHPTDSMQNGTLVNGLLYKYQLPVGLNEFRPGIVHRLDKDTSGVMVVAKNSQSFHNLLQQISNKEAERKYLALVEGKISERFFMINKPIKRVKNHAFKREINITGKESMTEVEVLECNNSCSLLCCTLKTGRTHQIRIHLASIGHPIVGDWLYGKEKNRFGIKGQALHSWRLNLKHPKLANYMTFYAEIPENFNNAINFLLQT